jgi:hypothetical protein
MAKSEKRLVLIYRASEGTASGRIERIGIADLLVHKVSLGTPRMVEHRGNGCPTPTLTHEHASVFMIEIGRGWYVLRENLSKHDNPDVEWRVIIRHDEQVEFLPADRENRKAVYLIEDFREED